MDTFLLTPSYCGIYWVKLKWMASWEPHTTNSDLFLILLQPSLRVLICKGAVPVVFEAALLIVALRIAAVELFILAVQQVLQSGPLRRQRIHTFHCRSCSLRCCRLSCRRRYPECLQCTGLSRNLHRQNSSLGRPLQYWLFHSSSQCSFLTWAL